MCFYYVHPELPEINKMLRHVGVPEANGKLFRDVRGIYSGRQTQKKLMIKTGCRTVIAEASGCEMLKERFVSKFDKLPTAKLADDLQRILQWDAPQDVVEFTALCGKGEDPLASEFFNTLCETWATVFPKLFPSVFRGMKCPPLEMMVLLLRWVCSFLFDVIVMHLEQVGSFCHV